MRLNVYSYYASFSDSTSSEKLKAAIESGAYAQIMISKSISECQYLWGLAGVLL